MELIIRESSSSKSEAEMGRSKKILIKAEMREEKE